MKTRQCADCAVSSEERCFQLLFFCYPVVVCTSARCLLTMSQLILCYRVTSYSLRSGFVILYNSVSERKCPRKLTGYFDPTGVCSFTRIWSEQGLYRIIVRGLTAVNHRMTRSVDQTCFIGGGNRVVYFPAQSCDTVALKKMLRSY